MKDPYKSIILTFITAITTCALTYAFTTRNDLDGFVTEVQLQKAEMNHLQDQVAAEAAQDKENNSLSEKRDDEMRTDFSQRIMALANLVSEVIKQSQEQTRMIQSYLDVIKDREQRLPMPPPGRGGYYNYWNTNTLGYIQNAAPNP